MRGSLQASAGVVPGMFLFFSNRMGCAGSLLLTAIGTVLILLLMGVIRL
ncbi:hypothetical protein [Sphingomonas mesophila]|nr:hypothetical protein [Sphingomonas mesophila]